jgi:hypothetical protein
MEGEVLSRVVIKNAGSAPNGCPLQKALDLRALSAGVLSLERVPGLSLGTCTPVGLPFYGVTITLVINCV